MGKIILSRHARRRARLYNIPESLLIKILGKKPLSSHAHKIIENVEGYRYPLKIIYTEENDCLTVITVYPLKKGGQDESVL
jgi:hypothetical protein